MLGALIGVTVLTNVDGDAVRSRSSPSSCILVGLRILVASAARSRLRRPAPTTRRTMTTACRVRRAGRRRVAAAAGGITNGLVGAWGPVVTPFLLHRGLAAALRHRLGEHGRGRGGDVSAVSLIASLGGDGIDIGIVLAMLVGGVLGGAARGHGRPVHPGPGLGVAVAGLLLATNVRELSTWGDLGPVRWAAYGLVGVLVAAAALRPRWLARRAMTQTVHPSSLDVV